MILQLWLICLRKPHGIKLQPPRRLSPPPLLSKEGKLRGYPPNAPRSLSSFSRRSTREAGEVVGDDRQMLGLYIKGIDRPDDEANVKKYFGDETWMAVKIVDATDKFSTRSKTKYLCATNAWSCVEFTKKFWKQKLKFLAGFYCPGNFLYRHFRKRRRLLNRLQKSPNQNPP